MPADGFQFNNPPLRPGAEGICFMVPVVGAKWLITLPKTRPKRARP